VKIKRVLAAVGLSVLSVGAIVPAVEAYEERSNETAYINFVAGRSGLPESSWANSYYREQHLTSGYNMCKRIDDGESIESILSVDHPMVADSFAIAAYGAVMNLCPEYAWMAASIELPSPAIVTQPTPPVVRPSVSPARPAPSGSSNRFFGEAISNTCATIRQIDPQRYRNLAGTCPH
jgi:hypothetical protein